MKKAINLKAWVLLSLTILAGGAFVGCEDEVDKSNRFTFTGDLISTYLEKYPENYSHFTEILSKAVIGKKADGNMLKTLSTYGCYTCIAPTNQALEIFVQEQYDKALEGESTGVTSPLVSELSVEKCTEIARNHIIEKEFRTLDFNDGYNLPEVTMNFRSVLVGSDIVNGNREYYLGDETALVLESDIITENGTIHVINDVLNPSNDNAAEILKTENRVSIFRDALNKTGLGALLAKFEIDENYDGELTGPKFGTEPGIPEYPQTKNQKFTLLIEPDIIYNQNGINNVDDLIAFAERTNKSTPGYEQIYNHPYNALFKFISYHIIDRSLDFVKGGPGGWIMEGYDANNFKSSVNMSETDYDWSDYFETYLPYPNWKFNDDEVKDINENGNIPEGCMIKVTRPFTNADYRNDVIINYCPSTSAEGTNIKVIKQTEAGKKLSPELEGITLNPENATIHLLDKILFYNEDAMIKHVLNERLRWDVISCFPELTSNLVRWNTKASPTCTYIPCGGDNTEKEKQYSKRLQVLNSSSTVYYLRPHEYSGGYPNYQGDELLIDGKYDCKYRLPHVPENTYEIRIGFSLSNARGVCQFYLNQDICGIPVDMRNTTANMAKLGWFDDSDMTEKEISDAEKAMRNRGFMMAPASIRLSDSQTMRANNLAMRRIIGAYYLTPRKDGYWLRFKNVTEGSTGTNEQFNQDYLEIVPKTVYANATVPEDRN